MSFNIDSNLRLEFGRQRQAELLQRAQRDKLEHALSAEIANDAGLQPHRSRSILPCVATARHFQGRLDDHRARTPDGRRTGGGTTSSPPRKATCPPRRRRVAGHAPGTLRTARCRPNRLPHFAAGLRVRLDSNMGRAGMRRFIMVTLVIAAFAVVSTAGTANASTKWPARCSNFKCVNAHLNAVHTSAQEDRRRTSTDSSTAWTRSRSRSTPTS